MKRRNIDSLVDKIVGITAVAAIVGGAAHCGYEFTKAELARPSRRTNTLPHERYELRGPISSQMYVPTERIQEKPTVQNDAPRRLVPY
ncbi:MAG TPA: hypothetical protein VJB66_04400 [Candidatus Nanoarchaeia archaeon]|nr:hypothetical protein [Candidatus Nanoarchaeia archaeon]